jgi:hypothetical protein
LGDASLSASDKVVVWVSRVTLKFWLDASLFAKFVGGDPVESVMAFDRECFFAVAIDRMPAAFSDEGEAIGFEVFDEITPFD